MTKLLQLAISGVALGSLYALLAMGFAIVLRATRVLNLFQAGIVLLGGYVCYSAHNTWGLPFVPAVLVTMAICAAVGFAVAALIGPRLSRASLLTSVLVTAGLLYAVQPVVQAAWGDDNLLTLNDPWGLRTDHFGSVAVSVEDLWLLGIAAVTLAAVWYLISGTSVGVAMRAAASDPEAATVQGIRPKTVIRLTWGLAATLGGLAGVMASTAVGGGVRPTLPDIAFAALPGMIVGGLSSTGGAALGGLAVGLLQSLAAGYAPGAWGSQFSDVAPYLALLVVLIVRPRGLVGEPVLRSA